MSKEAGERTRFAARELLARFERELGAQFPEAMRAHMSGAFEIGFLRGWGEGFTSGMSTAEGVMRSVINRHLHPPMTGRGYTPGCPCADCVEREREAQESGGIERQRRQDRELGEAIAKTNDTPIHSGNPELAAQLDQSDTVARARTVEVKPPTLHAQLDSLVAGSTNVREWSPERTEACPVEDTMRGGFCESDEQLRTRLARQRAEPTPHHRPAREPHPFDAIGIQPHARFDTKDEDDND